MSRRQGDSAEIRSFHLQRAKLRHEARNAMTGVWAESQNIPETSLHCLCKDPNRTHRTGSAKLPPEPRPAPSVEKQATRRVKN